MAICPNDNAHDRSHTSYEASLRLSVRQLIRSSAPLLLLLAAQRSTAQSTTSLVTDASVLPRGMVGIRVLTSWTRWDEQLGFGTNAQGVPQNIGVTLNTGVLGPADVPTFAVAESAIRALSGMPAFTLSAGNVLATADARVVTAPLIAEYGVTNRLTVGLIVPLVETRSTVFAQLNPHPGVASVGPNPEQFNANQQTLTGSLVTSLRQAAIGLQQTLTQCLATPTGTNCSAILAQQSTVQALIQSAGSFATGVETLYGTGPDHPGQPFVPLAGQPAQAAIDAELNTLRTQFAQFLPSSPINGSVVGAAAVGGQAQFQTLLKSLGHDTLGLVDRTSIGDISIGAVYQLLNTYGDTTAVGRRLRYRLAVNGAFRFGTGEPGDRNRLFDQSTGYGQSGAVVGGAADVRFDDRFSATALASYTAQLGTISVARLANPFNALLPLLPSPPSAPSFSAGNVVSLSLLPRVVVAGNLSFNVEYQYTHTGADVYSPVPAGTQAGLAAATAQQYGFGFIYSTVTSAARAPGGIPIEARFRHLETLAGSGGPVPKTFQDLVEMRIYVVP